MPKGRRLNGGKTRKLRKCREEAVIRQVNRCFWCGAVFTNSNRATADHLVPHSKGGKISIDNIVAVCFTCNQDRANLTVFEYEMKLFKRKHDGANQFT